MIYSKFHTNVPLPMYRRILGHYIYRFQNIHSFKHNFNVESYAHEYNGAFPSLSFTFRSLQECVNDFTMGFQSNYTQRRGPVIVFRVHMSFASFHPVSEDRFLQRCLPFRVLHFHVCFVLQKIFNNFLTASLGCTVQRCCDGGKGQSSDVSH